MINPTICGFIVQGQKLHATNFCCHFPEKRLLLGFVCVCVVIFFSSLFAFFQFSLCWTIRQQREWHKINENIPLFDQKCPLPNSFALPWKMNIFTNPYFILLRHFAWSIIKHTGNTKSKGLPCLRNTHMKIKLMITLWGEIMVSFIFIRDRYECMT